MPPLMVLIVTGWLLFGTSAQFWPSMKNPNESLNALATLLVVLLRAEDVAEAHLRARRHEVEFDHRRIVSGLSRKQVQIGITRIATRCRREGIRGVVGVIRSNGVGHAARAQDDAPLEADAAGAALEDTSANRRALQLDVADRDALAEQ